MPKKDRTKFDDALFEQNIADCFIGGRISGEQRRDIALKWCLGKYEEVQGIAEGLGVMPIAMIVGCLIDIEHPLLVENGRLLFRSLTACAVKVLYVELIHEVVHIPIVDNSGQSQFVHNLGGEKAEN